MSSKEYKLSDNVNDSFTFDLRGFKYEMRYPRADQVEQMQSFAIDLEEAKKNEDNIALAKINKETEAYLYTLISPIGHEKSISEALSTENIKVVQNFNNMIKTELAV